MIYKHFATQWYTAFLAPAFLLQWLNEEICLYEHFCCWAPVNNSNRGLARCTIQVSLWLYELCDVQHWRCCIPSATVYRTLLFLVLSVSLPILLIINIFVMVITGITDMFVMVITGITDMFMFMATPLIARFMGPIWGPPGADRTKVGPMLAPWTLLSELHS